MEWHVPTLITIDRLTVALPGAETLRDVSFRVPVGRIGVVVGSGARRRALFECLAALRKPSAGRISIVGAQGMAPAVAYLSDVSLRRLAPHVPLTEQAALWACALNRGNNVPPVTSSSRYVGSCSTAELALAWCRVATTSGARVVVLDLPELVTMNDPSFFDLLIEYVAVRSAAILLGADYMETPPRSAAWRVELSAGATSGNGNGTPVA